MDKFTFLEKIFSKVVMDNQSSVTCFAPTNIALVKYWGKRDQQINLPMTNSLSLTLPDFGTTTTLSLNDDVRDHIILNEKKLAEIDPIAQRVSAFLDIFRRFTKCHYHIETENNIPTAAGLASSASAYAALVLALDKLHGWGLDKQTLSIFARLGSGSACRSLWNGFVIWQMGKRFDGADSFGESFDDTWPELCLGIVLLDPKPKAISSREAMQQTVQSSKLYQHWPEQVADDFEVIKQAIRSRTFDVIGRTAEANALSMHATMMGARPPIIYSTSQTWQTIEAIWQLRADGIPVYFTQDAGPNVKVLFLQSNLDAVTEKFPNMQVQSFA